MIDPKLSQQRRFGIQGGVSFDPKTANVPLYKSIETFLKGAQGLGGSGGALANAPKLDAGFQQSHVFNNMSMRQQVQDRLEKQLTEHLQSLVGEQAAAQNMSIPSFLQSQGIRGISETKTGNLSAYKTDNFLKTSFNPISSSTERMAKASMKMSGALPTVSGGSNEHRRLSAYLRAPEAKHIVNMVQQTADEVSSGTYNKGPMEGLYASAGDRIDARSRQKTVQNLAGTFDLESRSPGAIAEAESMLLKQQAKKDLYATAEQGLKDRGLLPADEEKGGTGKGAASKAMVAISNASLTVMKDLKTMVLSMVSILKKISMDMGRLIMDSAEVGIDPNLADRMRRWGLANPTYSGGNENIAMDALKEFNSKYGDITRLDSNANFKSSAFNRYASNIGLTVDAALMQDPLQGMKKIYGSMASQYMGSKDKRGELQTQIRVLQEDFGSTFAQFYAGLINSGTEQGWLTKDNAKNIFNEATDPSRIDKMGTTGVMLDSLTGSHADAVGIEHNTKSVNAVLGDIAKLQNALYMMLLSNMDIIIQILLSISKGILGFMVKLGVPGAKEGLETLTKTEKGMALSGYREHLTNTEKYRADAEGRITDYLKGKRLKGEELASARSDIFNRLSANQEMPEEYKDVLKGDRGYKIIAGNAIYNKGQQLANDMYNNIQKGNFVTSGDVFNLANKSGYDIKRKGERYGSTGTLRYNYVEGVEGRKLGKGISDEIDLDVSGENALNVTGGYKEHVDLGFIKSFEKIEDTKVRSNREAQKATDDIMNSMPGWMKPKKKEKKPGVSYNPYSGVSDMLASSQLPSGEGSGAMGDATFRVINEVIVKDSKGNIIATNVSTLSDREKLTSWQSTRTGLMADG